MAYRENSDETSPAIARGLAAQAVKQLQADHYRALRLGANFLPVAKNSQPDNYDRTDILQVCQYRDLAALQDLHAQGFDFMRRDGEFALRTAVRNGYIEIVAALLDYGADINGWNGALLEKAILHQNMDIADLLVERGLTVDSLPDKARQAYGKHKLVQQEVNAKNLQTLTEAFKAATWTGHLPEMLELWKKVPEPLHEKLDFQHVLTEIKQVSLKQGKSKIIFIK